MVRQICLDSNVLIELLKGNKEIICLLEGLDAEFWITSINSFELWVGRLEKESLKIGDFISSFSIAVFDIKSSLRAGDVLRALKKHGFDLDIRDVFIASICIQHDLELLTLNKKHFVRMKELGLKLV